jgi:hypothetical protein
MVDTSPLLRIALSLVTSATSNEPAAALKILPAQVWELRQRPREAVGRSSRARLHDTQVGAWRHTQARQLIGGDAPISRHHQLVVGVLVRCHALILLWLGEGFVASSATGSRERLVHRHEPVTEPAHSGADDIAHVSARVNRCRLIDEKGDISCASR